MSAIRILINPWFTRIIALTIFVNCISMASPIAETKTDVAE